VTPARSNHSPAKRRIAAAMVALATSLAAMSILHLSATLDPHASPGRVNDAGVIEAVICIVLIAGAVALVSDARRGAGIALASLAFAIVGFLVGLTVTIRDGQAIDAAYHASVLPLLALTATAVHRHRHRATVPRLGRPINGAHHRPS
jgi:uncharacterized membrane protein